jgi:hypothetical protein
MPAIVHSPHADCEHEIFLLNGSFVRHTAFELQELVQRKDTASHENTDIVIREAIALGQGGNGTHQDNCGQRGEETAARAVGRCRGGRRKS